jgi:DNA-binding XRE family transcriptional regulator
LIRTESEYLEALKRITQDREVASGQRKSLEAAGLPPGEVEIAMQPLLSFHAQLQEEVEWYENIKRGNFPTIHRLTQIGHVLIALRIALGITQRDLAERLGVAESTVSRDERNEYHGITLERAQRVIDALEASVETRVEQPERELAGVS